MIAEHEYVGALTILYEFLKSYNKDDAYHDVRNWDPDGFQNYEDLL